MVEIINLTKNYSNQRVINNLNYTLTNGIHGIIGKNGAGKTTLFNCIYGTEKYSGKIKRSNNISYLPSELYFYPRVRGIEFLEFICATKNQVLKKENIDKLNQFFKLPLTRYAKNYSTGMKKKLGLLAIFLIKGDVLLLDEPFNGLDIESQAISIELMQLLKQNHKTILISSHITTHLTTTCNSIHLLNNGNILHQYQKNDFNNVDSEITNILQTTINNFKNTFK
jgi:ABC-2 type transport system ATP-binding protein